MKHDEITTVIGWGGDSSRAPSRTQFTTENPKTLSNIINVKTLNSSSSDRHRVKMLFLCLYNLKAT